MPMLGVHQYVLAKTYCLRLADANTNFRQTKNVKRSNTSLEDLNIKASNIVGRNTKVRTCSLFSPVGTPRAFLVTFVALDKSYS